MIKIIIITFIILLIVAVAFLIARKPAVKLMPAQIQITKIKSQYNTSENVVVAGTAQKNSKITVLLNNNFGMINSDNSGQWKINFGNISAGKYNFEVISADSQNSNSVDAKEILVADAKESKGILSLLKGAENELLAGLTQANNNMPAEITMVPQQIPPVLQNSWDLLK